MQSAKSLGDFFFHPGLFNMVLAQGAGGEVVQSAQVGVDVHNLDCAFEVKGVGPVGPHVGSCGKVAL